MPRILVIGLLFLAVNLYAQQTPVTTANYQAAARFSPKKLEKMVFSTAVDPHWLKKTNRFWYVYETTEGKKWYIVDPVKGEKKVMFDNDKLAAGITRIVKDPFEAKHLGLDSMRFIKDENWIQFEVKSSQDAQKKDSAAAGSGNTDEGGTGGRGGRRGGGGAAAAAGAGAKDKKIYYFEYNLLDGTLNELVGFKKPTHKPNWANISPDSNTIVFGRHFNLYWMDRANYQKALKKEDDSSIVEHALTTDGVEYYSYHGNGGAGGGGGETNVDKEKNKDKRKPAQLFWSPDSRHFVLSRSDQRKVKDLWVINSLAEPRPTLETYKYMMPGEKEAPVEQLVFFDLGAKSHMVISEGLFKDQDMAIWSAPAPVKNRDDEYRTQLWLGTNTHFYFTRTSRDLHRIDVCEAEVGDTVAKAVIQERLNTYVEVRRLGLVNGGKELIEWSERDGWGHFYLYDGNGKLKNQITSGSFHCEDIIGIDEKKRILYFSANGREEGEDPYYLHMYKANFDGTGLALLDPGDFDHTVSEASMDDEQQFFVDNFSRVNTVPKSVLYNSAGRKVMDLETADLSSLMAAGYKFPQPFKVKADDGITDIYGVLYKPYNFDSTKKYAMMEYVYPGPQTEAVNKSFGRGMDHTDRLAQLGMIVITMGNRGGHPSRSKWYHNYGYGNLRDYGLADKKAAAEQLADRYSFIDINRVGIHGHSGGGFQSTAAMLVYPDFFKVAVSESGNHDNAIYNRWWSEKHHGVKEVVSDKGDTSFVYSIEKNPELAKNLKGRLLLSTGDIDNNVHPGNTIRLANALIKANKRFDFVLLPGQRHAYADMTEYFFWRTADYFSRYLIGDDTTRPVDIEQMDREVEQVGTKAAAGRSPNDEEGWGDDGDDDDIDQ
jgi:dipeptidyl aminopeptidase/acylaminoacyl peptidase